MPTVPKPTPLGPGQGRFADTQGSALDSSAPVRAMRRQVATSEAAGQKVDRVLTNEIAKHNERVDKADQIKYYGDTSTDNRTVQMAAAEYLRDSDPSETTEQIAEGISAMQTANGTRVGDLMNDGEKQNPVYRARREAAFQNSLTRYSVGGYEQNGRRLEARGIATVMAASELIVQGIGDDQDPSNPMMDAGQLQDWAAFEVAVHDAIDDPVKAMKQIQSAAEARDRARIAKLEADGFIDMAILSASSEVSTPGLDEVQRRTIRTNIQSRADAKLTHKVKVLAAKSFEVELAELDVYAETGVLASPNELIQKGMTSTEALALHETIDARNRAATRFRRDTLLWEATHGSESLLKQKGMRAQRAEQIKFEEGGAYLDLLAQVKLAKGDPNRATSISHFDKDDWSAAGEQNQDKLMEAIKNEAAYEHEGTAERYDDWVKYSINFLDPRDPVGRRSVEAFLNDLDRTEFAAREDSEKRGEHFNKNDLIDPDHKFSVRGLRRDHYKTQTQRSEGERMLMKPETVSEFDFDAGYSNTEPLTEERKRVLEDAAAVDARANEMQSESSTGFGTAGGAVDRESFHGAVGRYVGIAHPEKIETVKKNWRTVADPAVAGATVAVETVRASSWFVSHGRDMMVKGLHKLSDEMEASKAEFENQK